MYFDDSFRNETLKPSREIFVKRRDTSTQQACGLAHLSPSNWPPPTSPKQLTYTPLPPLWILLSNFFLNYTLMTFIIRRLKCLSIFLVKFVNIEVDSNVEMDGWQYILERPRSILVDSLAITTNIAGYFGFLSFTKNSRSNLIILKCTSWTFNNL